MSHRLLDQTKTQIMKNSSLLVLLFFSICTYAQEKTHEVLEITKDSDEIPFILVEKVPIYKGCNDKLDNIKLKACMSKGITNHIVQNFNTNSAKGLGLPNGKVRINAFFKINKKGNIKGIKIRSPHPKLEKETLRVLKSIPKMQKPGYHKGKPVTVAYSLPIVFNIDNSKYSKKK